jgi:hypothetical protein
MDWRLGGPQSRFGRGGEEIYSQPQPGLEPPIIQTVTQLYALCGPHAKTFFFKRPTKNYRIFLNLQQYNFNVKYENVTFLP